jgi:ribonucleoside-diphosphate reductase alpha chain
MYYLRTTAAADAIKFTVDKTALQEEIKTPVEIVESDALKLQTTLDYSSQKDAIACSLENPDDCEMCGS